MSFANVLNWVLKPLPIWQSLFYLMLIFMLVSSLLLLVIYLRYRAISTKDIIIFLEKSDRFRIIFDDIRGKSIYKFAGGTYGIDKPLLNSKGKALQIWSDNKPEPLRISYNRTEWLNADALTATINNEIIKRLVELSGKAKELLLMIGAAGSVAAAIVSIIILLIQLGVIKPR